MLNKHKKRSEEVGKGEWSEGSEGMMKKKSKSINFNLRINL